MSVFNRLYFLDEESPMVSLKASFWPDGAECPHCGVIGTAYKIAANPAKRVRYGLIIA
jgi:hypothetical protein